MSVLLLRLALLSRCVVSALFAWLIYSIEPPTHGLLFGVLERFLMTDGVLALLIVVASLGARWGSMFPAIAAVDGVVRIGAAVALDRAPGIQGFPVTMVLFTGLLAVLGFSIGLFMFLEAIRRGRESGGDGIGLTLWALGIVNVLLGASAFFGTLTPEASQTRLVTEASVQALAFAALSVSRYRSRRTAAGARHRA
jgi:hypothetical protein